MKQFFEHVMTALKGELIAVKLETNPLKRFSICVGLVAGTIEQLRGDGNFLSDYTGIWDQHVLFNRHYLPPLFAKLLYFRLCLDFERLKLCAIKEKHNAFCEDQLSLIAAFFKEHGAFVEYYYSGKTNLGDALFSWDNKDSPPPIASDSK